ncbi:MAG: polyprenyl synthetase family protein [Sphingobium sp.]|nr:polyprenyl synthetase family protein [Sphingobium sp.]MBP8671389.1 polyprenyl synthetase family protein [Sphingobium sp.]MBP9156282.1 polyprenyl synthetase family protein [Sphingobium sp.]MCC6482572.1 polyprenyl synthetase family protein [Sphingomonadaceae bacterium]
MIAGNDTRPEQPDLLRAAFTAISKDIDAAFDTLLSVPDDPRHRLYEAMRHATIGGGKRMRPLLVKAAGKLFSLDNAQLLRVGLAVECIHVYSLVHDDLPAMDDDDMRRGKPTVHRAFDEATAILAGDSLHDLAFEILTIEDTHADPFVRCNLVRALARASGTNGMAGGQMMDMAAESMTFDLHSITRLQQLKTGALIGFCVEAAAIMAHLPPEARTGLHGYARDIGLAFQIADDLLDIEGDAAVTGKAVGKDAQAGKQTFASLLGAERAREQARILVAQAKAHLHDYDERADLLRAIADYVIERDR